MRERDEPCERQAGQPEPRRHLPPRDNPQIIKAHNIAFSLGLLYDPAFEKLLIAGPLGIVVGVRLAAAAGPAHRRRGAEQQHPRELDLPRARSHTVASTAALGRSAEAPAARPRRRPRPGPGRAAPRSRWRSARAWRRARAPLSWDAGTRHH